MVNRTRRFTEADSQTLLDAVGICRRATIQASIKAPFGTEIDRACTSLRCALDDMAGTLTGNAEHFWNVQHSTHGNLPPHPVTLRTFKSLPWPPVAMPMNDRTPRKRPEA